MSTPPCVCLASSRCQTRQYRGHVYVRVARLHTEDHLLRFPIDQLPFSAEAERTSAIASRNVLCLPAKSEWRRQRVFLRRQLEHLWNIRYVIVTLRTDVVK